MSSPNDVKRVSTRDLQARKREGTKIVMVSAYDALFARLADEGGADAVLVGDSLGNVIAGYGSTIPVRLEHMIYHGGMVARGAARALVIIDMPFLTYQVSVEEAMRNCGRAIQESGAQAVKLEGGTPEIAEAVRAVARIGVPVMGHIGFTPQAVNTLGGYRVQGREAEAADRLVDEARRLEDAGAFGIVLELVPAALARRITEAVSIPTIGIGAGAGCDGQVLVLLDLLGLNDGFSPKFLKRYANLADQVRAAVRAYADEVRKGAYPDADHSF